MDGITDNTVTLLWMTTPQPNGIVKGYDVQYRRAGTSYFTTLNFTNFTGTITGLISYTSYEFRVAAVTAIGTGPYTILMNQRTGKLIQRISFITNLSHTQMVLLLMLLLQYCPPLVLGSHGIHCQLSVWSLITSYLMMGWRVLLMMVVRQ